MRAIQDLQHCCAPQIPLPKPVTLIDAFNQRSSIQLSWIDDWRAFNAVLKCKFDGCGSTKTERDEYVLTNSQSSWDVNTRLPIQSSSIPNQTYVMSMLFATESINYTACIRCLQPCDARLDRDFA